MTVKCKTLLVSIISVLFVIIMTCGIVYLVFLNFINEHEVKEVNNKFKIVDSIIQKEKDSMINTAIDWAHWDDTYNFLIDHNSDYLDSNLQDNTFEALKLNLIAYVDLEGNIIFRKNYNLQNEVTSSLNQELFLKTNNFEKLITFKNINDIKEGVLLVSGKPLVIIAAPITTSDEETQGNGTFIIGRFLEQDFFDYVDDITNTTFELTNLQSSTNMYLERIKSDESERSIHKSDTVITAYEKIIDIFNNNSIICTITMKREGYIHGKYFFETFVILYFVLIILVVSIDFYIADKYFLSRLKVLYNFVEEVAKTKDTNISITISGRDEISEFGNAINNMLFELNSASKEIKSMDERFRIIMEATNDGYLDFNVKKQELYICPQWQQYIGFSSDNATDLYEEYLRKVCYSSPEKVREAYCNFIGTNKDYFEGEYKMKKSSGETLWVFQKGKVVSRDENGKAERVVCTLSDVTRRKKYEEEILFLSYHDKLTGLKNRMYIENRFKEIDNMEDISYSIIMGDLNGLKLINDTFGHKEGGQAYIYH